MKAKTMRCISVEEDAKKYFAQVTFENAVGRRLVKTGYLLGVLEAVVESDEGKGELLVISVHEVARLLREATEVKKKR